VDSLITLYLQRLNLHNATFSRIIHDDAIVAIVYKIMQPTGIAFVVKICTRPEEYLREVYFLKHFANKLPVPHIIQTIAPEANIHGAILMSYLPGAPLKITDITNELAYEIGSQFARIHSNRTAGYGDLIEPKNLTPDPRVYFSQQFETGLSECSQHLPPELLEQCRNYYNTHLDLLTTVDGPCIVHRDFRPGNLMIHDNKLQGIIDWSTSRASFAEEDFRTIEHNWDWSINPASKTSFLAGYASIRPVPNYTTIMPLLRLSRSLDILGFTLKRNTWQSTNAHVYKHERQFLDTFFSTF
jgi:Ser/Thr protein kinase RdoA (MazF antagonist)